MPRVRNPDPELESAISGDPPIKLTAKQLAKTGWTNAEGVHHHWALPESFSCPNFQASKVRDQNHMGHEPIASSEERLRPQAASKQHQFTHRPENPL